MKKIVAIVAVVLILAVVIFIKVKGGDKQIIITTDIVGEEMLVATLKQTGIIKPQVGALISIGARATGKLDMVSVKVGDRVKEGEFVAKIDSRSTEQAIIQSKDSISKADAELNKELKVFPLQKQMQINTIEAARSNYEYLNGVYEREKVLYEKGYSRKETLDKTEHDMINSKSEYSRQKLQLDYMIANHETSVLTMRADINRLKSMLVDQEINLTYTKIYSPINGVVNEVNSVEGETIVAGLEVAKLITVFRPELLEMHIFVDESDVGKVNAGMDVKYTVDTYPDKEFLGKIEMVYLQPENKDGVIYYKAIVDIDEETALLFRPEMTTNVQIITEERKADVTIASAAVKWESGSQVVYKVIDKGRNITQKIPVKVGLRGERRVEILEGLELGDEAVVRFGDSKSGKK